MKNYLSQLAIDKKTNRIKIENIISKIHFNNIININYL